MVTKKWYQSKTIWTCIAGACTAIGAWATGELSTPIAVFAVFEAFRGIFERSAIR